MIKKIKELKISYLNRILRKVMAHINKFEGIYKCLYVYCIISLFVSAYNITTKTTTLELTGEMVFDVVSCIAKYTCLLVGIYEIAKIFVLDINKGKN